MNKTNRAAHWINDENGAAIRDINPQGNAALICDKSIRAIEAPRFLERLLDHSDSIPMHLLSRGESHSVEAQTLAKISMNLIEPG
jgi:hypothetical protein